MVKANHNDVDRFTAIFRRHYQDVLRFAGRRVPWDQAQEVAETFLVLWRRVHDVPDPALPWLFRVPTYEIANHRRRVENHRRDTQLQRA